jgi:hypothetical protein
MKLSNKPRHFAPKNTKIVGMNSNCPGHKSLGGIKVFESEGNLLDYLLTLFGIFRKKDQLKQPKGANS